MPVRKVMNGVLRLFRVIGEFCTASEIAERFTLYGFAFSGAAYNGYAQAVKLDRQENNKSQTGGS